MQGDYTWRFGGNCCGKTLPYTNQTNMTFTSNFIERKKSVS